MKRLRFTNSAGQCMIIPERTILYLASSVKDDNSLATIHAGIPHNIPVLVWSGKADAVEDIRSIISVFLWGSEYVTGNDIDVLDCDMLVGV